MSENWSLARAVEVYGEPKRGWLTEGVAPHLSRWEIACRCGCGEATISRALAYLWAGLRVAHGEPLVIASGCRCVAHNKAEGGERDSLHIANGQGTGAVILPGRALDIRIPRDVPLIPFFDLVSKVVHSGGFGTYASPKWARPFFHVDTGEGVKPGEMVKAFRRWAR